MSSVHPIAEFRDADQYRQSVAGEGQEIIRPKPRRPGEYRYDAEAVVVTCSSGREIAQMGTGSSILRKALHHENHVDSGSKVQMLPSSKLAQDIKTPNIGQPIANSRTHIFVKSANCEIIYNNNMKVMRDKEKPPIPIKPVHDCFHPFNRSHPELQCHSSHVPVMSDVNNSVTIHVEPYLDNADFNDDDEIGWKDRDPNKNSRPMMLQTSPVSTDCTSRSKSSSDGDAVILRKRPPTKLKSRRRNILSFPHHLSIDEMQFVAAKPNSYSSGCGGSSSDENRSSGHASMSDSRGSSSPATEPLNFMQFIPDRNHHDHSNNHHFLDYQETHSNYNAIAEVGLSPCRSQLKCVPEDDKVIPTQCKPINKRIQFGRNRYHKDDLRIPLESNSGLEDIRQAIETLTVRSQGSRTSYSTSTYSSMSGSESEPIVRRLIRTHSSLETINTNVTNADEFVWIDSHSRLVELQHLPWTNKEILQLLQNGRLKDAVDQISMETIPRLSHLLQRAMVRIAREIQRFAKPLGICSKREVNSALKVILSPTLADSCVKACMRAATMYTVSGDQQFRQSKSARAGLQLSVGHFHRWMCDVCLGKFINEYAAVSLCAAIENLLEEIVVICIMHDKASALTNSNLEYAIANNGDLWGLLQPYSHLNAGRVASGSLAMPRWPSQSSEINSRTGSSAQLNEEQNRQIKRSFEQSLLTTCVGSVGELGDLLSRVMQHHNAQHAASSNNGRHTVTWGPSAVHTLFYFMRCSQLEHADHRNEVPLQELNYERPYVVLPPIVEWARIAIEHAEHRFGSVVDKDDVMQAARLLLPGIDCPIRQSSYDEMACAKRIMDDNECTRRFKVAVAFQMLTYGRTDLLPHALQFLPSTKINTINDQGLTLLMLACIRGDEAIVQILLNGGADIDIETPSNCAANPCVSTETQHWTALTYATACGNLLITKLLLEKGANVEGGAHLDEDKMTVTPLQLAAAAGNVEMVCLLLSHGAHPFLSTMTKDNLCYGSAAQRGCYSALSVAAAHGQRTTLHKLLSHPFNNGCNDVLSLEEMLAEGTTQLTNERNQNRLQIAAVSLEDSKIQMPSDGEFMQILKLSKQQVKALQEAMYHSAENGYLEITLDLRNIGIPWTLHCWMDTLATAHELRLESIIDQLLQDFQVVWPDDCSTQFIEECLPLLFAIFQHSKNEGTSLLLADIFSSCYGKEQIETIEENFNVGGACIDPKYVNNPELSDIQFRVENRIFYAHKIILINASPRFKSLLSTKHGEGNSPAIPIGDIRYEIFQLVMQYLYKGGCNNLDVDQKDILELMAAANYFLLTGLLRYCEVRCIYFISQDNIVNIYLHAKIYDAERLLEYCQGYLIQNMVALLSYDDSVRRLFFGKKLHNHDVLTGLLRALQMRINTKHKNQLTNV